MADSRSATLAKEPRRIALAVSSPNQRSTKLSQLELVGTKILHLLREYAFLRGCDLLMVGG